MSRPRIHACACCDKQISTAHLMCLEHWHEVPHALQQQLRRTHVLYRMAKAGVGGPAKTARRDFVHACEAAIAAVALPRSITTTPPAKGMNP